MQKHNGVMGVLSLSCSVESHLSTAACISKKHVAGVVLLESHSAECRVGGAGLGCVQEVPVAAHSHAARPTWQAHI